MKRKYIAEVMVGIAISTLVGGTMNQTVQALEKEQVVEHKNKKENLKKDIESEIKKDIESEIKKSVDKEKQCNKETNK